MVAKVSKIQPKITHPDKNEKKKNHSSNEKRHNRCQHWDDLSVRIIWQEFQNHYHKNASMSSYR